MTDAIETKSTRKSNIYRQSNIPADTAGLCISDYIRLPGIQYTLLIWNALSITHVIPNNVLYTRLEVDSDYDRLPRFNNSQWVSQGSKWTAELPIYVVIGKE